MASGLSEYEVLLRIHSAGETTRSELYENVRGDARFTDISTRTVEKHVRALKKEGLVTEDAGSIRVNPEKPGTWNLLAFIHWSRLNGRAYGPLLEKKARAIYKEVYDGTESIEGLVSATGLSRPTVLKRLKTLEECRFVEKTSLKPAGYRACINDHSLFYINLLNWPLKKAFPHYAPPKIEKIHPGKLANKLIRLHTYSTTVTEGNTATADDVKAVLSDMPVKLTPREILEIINTRKAIGKIYGEKEAEITEEALKDLHKTLTSNLLDSAGRYYYGRKKIIGSEHKPPSPKEAIDASMKALINHVNRHESKDPRILACTAHLLYASIHPFQDGNGRMARLLHSWILIKKDLPLFVYDPAQKNTYFNLLEHARNKDTQPFVEFCNTQQKKAVEKEMRKRGGEGHEGFL